MDITQTLGGSYTVHAQGGLFRIAAKDADDRVVWDHALSVGAAIVTKDEDFALRRTMTATGPAIVWVRRGNTRRRELLDWFDPLLPKVVQLLMRGDPLVEIR